MSVRKREGSPYYWTSFTVQGRRVRESTGTEDKGEAEQFEARLKTQLWAEAKLGVKARRDWQDAVIRYLGEQGHLKSIEDIKGHLRWLGEHLNDKKLDQIDRDLIDHLVVVRQQPREIPQPNGGKPKLIKPKPATINRMLAVIRAILRRAEREWLWLDKAPVVRMLPEPKRRIRWITRDDARRLLAELPEHQREAVIFELETGLRASNVTGLQWSQVDMARQCAWIHGDEAKAGESIAVPLTQLAREVLTRQIGKNDTYVFTYKGEPVKQLNTKAWKLALGRAGITNFRWHDLRHTWASWHAQSGTPQNILQELGGWESVEMVRRYAHLDGKHLLEHAERRNVISIPVAQS